MTAPVWLTTAAAAELANRWRYIASGGRAATISPAAIRQWASRGHLTATGINEAGHPLYTLAAVARAEKATRARALRLARH